MYPVIPKLKHCKLGEGFLPVSQLFVQPKQAADLEILTQRHNLCGRQVPICSLEDPNLKEEAYRIQIRLDAVQIWSSSPKGALYACSTLSQCLWQEGGLSCGEIEDEPEYPWRGFMLDISRHFFPLSYLKELVEQLSVYKFNRLHLHLSDDQGWRLEIDAYPLLTEIGSRRFLTSDSLYEGKGDEIGYLSKHDVRELLSHAAKYHVEIIPEIDLPGHTLAVVSAYPELTCFPEGLVKFPVSDTWGIYKEVLCLAKPQVWDFVYKVLDEVAELFPSRYIHLGGDEVPLDHWEECPHCQEFQRQNNILESNGLQNFFTQKTRDYLLAKGKQPIYWDEIEESGMSDGAIIHHWRTWGGGLSEDSRIEGVEWDVIAAEHGTPVVSCPVTGAYFDYAHSSDPHERGNLGNCRVYDTYHFPTLRDKRPDLGAYALGVQANLWTEKVLYPRDCEYMMFPRLLAMAEQAWRKSGWQAFKHAWAGQQSVLKALGIQNYYRGPWQ